MASEIRSTIALKCPLVVSRQQVEDTASEILGSDMEKCLQLFNSELSVDDFIRSLLPTSPKSIQEVCTSRYSSPSKAPEVEKSQGTSSLLASASQPKSRSSRKMSTKNLHFDSMFPNELKSYLQSRNLETTGSRQDLVDRCRSNEREFNLNKGADREVLLDNSDNKIMTDVAVDTTSAIASAPHSASCDDQPQQESYFKRMLSSVFTSEC